VSEVRYPVVAPGVGDFRGAAGSEPAAHWKATAAGERLVPTHCCFCGVQCGMYLRVTDGRVIGVEPRNHDINKLRLCPKGVSAYQQVHHPDRLLSPLMRDSRDGPCTWSPGRRPWTGSSPRSAASRRPTGATPSGCSAGPA
jgi:assimilatory nitrate reductase catalytic subunit